jgi:hypothetical protein
MPDQITPALSARTLAARVTLVVAALIGPRTNCVSATPAAFLRNFFGVIDGVDYFAGDIGLVPQLRGLCPRSGQRAGAIQVALSILGN